MVRRKLEFIASLSRLSYGFCFCEEKSVIAIDWHVFRMMQRDQVQSGFKKCNSCDPNDEAFNDKVSIISRLMRLIVKDKHWFQKYEMAR